MVSAGDKDGDRRGHPYGVEPLGNIFLGKSPSCKPKGLGTLAMFDDERMLDLMGFMSAHSLGRLAVVSRALYVYAHVEELWKTLVVQEMAGRPGQAVETRGGWKTTMQHMVESSAPPPASPSGGGGDASGEGRRGVPHVPLKVRGFFSDLLFQPHHCATATIKAEWVSRSSVDRKAGLSAEEFRRLYEEPNRPVVLTDGAKSWPALHQWTPEKLSATHGDLRLHAGGLEFALKDYLRYAGETKDELPLYVFDKHFVKKCPELGRGYTVPQVFEDDLFSVLGEERRPDHRWLIAGPARSGSSFHVDPNCTSAWNATVSGRKKWIMFPPGETPPGVHPSEDGLDLAAPVSIMEWFLNFYQDCHAPGRKVRPLECVASAGEVVFVPMGWWHCVLNLEWSVAITQNFVSRVNLPHVVKFLLTQKHLISGLPPEQRGDLGELFVSELDANHPDLAVKRMAELAVADDDASNAVNATANAAGAASKASKGSGVSRTSDGSGGGSHGGEGVMIGNNSENEEEGSSRHGTKKLRLWERLKQGGQGGGCRSGAKVSSGGRVGVEGPAHKATGTGQEGERDEGDAAGRAEGGVVGEGEVGVGVGGGGGGGGGSGGFSFSFSFA